MRLVDFTNKITNFLNSVWIYAVEDVVGAPTDGYVVMKDLIDYIKTDVPVIGYAYDSDESDLSVNGTSYTDIGMQLNYTPKRTDTQLKVCLNSMLRLSANQKGVRYELNYSLDNGNTYNTVDLYYKTISIYNGVYDDGINACVLIPAPATSMQCIFKINAKVITNGINATLRGSLKPIILEVTELNI